ncbi:hypothetical protein NPIL_41491 [Nephila pilipes]|uniref:Uncharacterized protein n=1 Tax=Nephila pilipes TaxID=299642 RepID=A0A8X6Q909_NEPPI|nr:hypothetical protein NPIL_41491 [Nephila pilipes]
MFDSAPRRLSPSADVTVVLDVEAYTCRFSPHASRSSDVSGALEVEALIRLVSRHVSTALRSIKWSSIYNSSSIHRMFFYP